MNMPELGLDRDGLSLPEAPRTNEELLGLAEGQANALRECDERMGKIRDAQP